MSGNDKINKAIARHRREIVGEAVRLAEADGVSFRSVIVLATVDGTKPLGPIAAVSRRDAAQFLETIHAATGVKFELPEYPEPGHLLVVVAGAFDNEQVVASYEMQLAPDDEIARQQSQQVGEELVTLEREDQLPLAADIAAFDMVKAGDQVCLRTRNVIGSDLHYAFLRLDFFDVSIRRALKSEGSARYIAARRGPSKGSLFVRSVSVIDIEVERVLRDGAAAFAELDASRSGGAS